MFIKKGNRWVSFLLFKKINQLPYIKKGQYDCDSNDCTGFKKVNEKTEVMKDSKFKMLRYNRPWHYSDTLCEKKSL